MMAKDKDHCPICKQFIAVLVSGFKEIPFIDGKTYEAICHCCSEVPKMYDFDTATQKFIFYDKMEPSRLHTVEELVEDGWNKKVAEISYKAIKNLVKRKI